MQPTSLNFKENAARALHDPQLQRALGHVKTGFVGKRSDARAGLPEFDALRAASVDIKNHVLEHLDIYLEEYERQVIASGGHVHWARDAAEAREIILKLCRDAGAKSVTKGKSMVAEEIGLNDALEAAGIEPLKADLDRFLGLFRGRKTPIKTALLNQKLLSGVGNIYADESLFRAGIRPRRRASTITRAQLAKLLSSVKEVLKEAIALGGSSISDYVDADGEAGFFQLQHRVYGREGEPCLVCKNRVKRIVIAGRSSHYCAKCQK